MPKPIRKNVPDPDNKNKMVPGTVIKIKEVEEPLCYTRLEDGTTITAKIFLMEAVRINDRWDKNGAPIYNVRLNATFSVSAPDTLMRKVKGKAWKSP